MTGQAEARENGGGKGRARKGGLRMVEQLNLVLWQRG